MAAGGLQWLYNLLDVVVIPADDPLLNGILTLLDVLAATAMDSDDCKNSETEGLNLKCLVNVIAAVPDTFGPLLYGVLRYGDDPLGGVLGGVDPIVSNVIKNLIGEQ